MTLVPVHLQISLSVENLMDAIAQPARTDQHRRLVMLEEALEEAKDESLETLAEIAQALAEYAAGE
jgi:predicted transcriptional regulator